MNINKRSKLKLFPVLMVPIFCALFYSCKPSAPEDSASSNYRSGSAYGASCNSSSLYHKRLKEQLEYLGNEFYFACMGKKNTTVHGPTQEAPQGAALGLRGGGRSATKSGFDSSMWTGDFAQGSQGIFSPENILRYSGFDESSFDQANYQRLKREMKADLDGSEIKYNTDDYLFLPQMFKEGGKLADLRIVNRLHNGSRYTKDWRNSFKQYSQQCKNHLLTIKDRVREIENTAGAFTANCCKLAGDGRPNFSQGNLTCANGVPKALKKSIHFEWPICGRPESTCFPKNFMGSDGQTASCTRCELRTGRATKGKKFYLPASPKPGVSRGYNEKIARQSRITCLTAPAARGAIATWCINSNDGFCKDIKYTTPVKEIFEKVTPFLHCTDANPEVVPADRYNALSEGAMRFVDFSQAATIGGEMSVSASLDFFVKASGKLRSAISTSGTNIFQIRSNGVLPIFVYRDGRLELNGGSKVHCAGLVATSTCKGGELGAGINGSPLPWLSLSADIKASAAKCKSEGKMDATDWNYLPTGGGLTIDQAAAACNRFSTSNYAKVFDADILKRLVDRNDEGNFVGIDSLIGVEFLKVDLSNRHLYCGIKRNFYPGASQEDKLKYGTKLKEIYLYTDGATDFSIGLRAFETKFLDSKIDIDKRVKVPNYKHETFKPLMKPSATSQELLTIINNYFQKVPPGGQNKRRNKFPPLGGFNCEALNAPTTFEFGKKVTCSQWSNNSNMVPMFSTDTLSLQQKGVNLTIQALKGEAVTAEFSSPVEDLGSWPQMLLEGALKPADALSMLESLVEIQTAKSVNCRL